MRALLIGPENPHFAGHLRTLQTLPEVTAITVCCADSGDMALLQAAVASDTPKVLARFASVNEALAGGHYDFVLGCPRNDRALAVYEAVFAHKLPALAEKPLGRNAAEAEQICNMADAAGVTLGVCYQNRYNPVVRYAREFIAAGLLGRLMQVQTRYVTTNIAARDPNHWLFKRECVGGGVLQWLGCHHVDVARYVANDEIIHATGHVGTLNGHDISVEDTATISYRFASGAVGGLHCAHALAQSGGGLSARWGGCIGRRLKRRRPCTLRAFTPIGTPRRAEQSLLRWVNRQLMAVNMAKPLCVIFCVPLLMAASPRPAGGMPWLCKP